MTQSISRVLIGIFLIGSVTASATTVFHGSCVLEKPGMKTPVQTLPFSVSQEDKFQGVSFVRPGGFPYVVEVYNGADTHQEVGYFLDPSPSSGMTDPHPVRAYSFGPAVAGHRVLLFANIDDDNETITCDGTLVAE